MACESDRSTALRNRICSFAGPAARSSNADKRRLKSLAMVNDDRTPRHAAAVDAESWSIPWTYDVRWWTSRPKINSRRHGRRPRPRSSRRRRQRLMPAESCGTSWGRGTRTDEQVAQDRDRILRNVVIAFVFRDRLSARSPWRPSAASASRSPASASRRTRSSARPRWRNTASPPLRSPARAQVEAGSDRQSSPGAIVISGAESSGQNPVGWALTRIEPTFVSSAPRLIDGSVEPVAEMPVPSPPAPAELPAESPGARASAAVVAMAAIVEWRAMCMKWSLRQRGWLPLNTETPGGWITRGVVRAGNRIVRGKPRRSLSAGGGGPRAPHAPSLVSSPTRW